MEVAERCGRARLSLVLGQQCFYLRTACRIGNHVTGSQCDSRDGRLGLLGRETGLVSEELNRLIDAPSAAGQFRIDNGTSPAHAFPLRREVTRIEIVAI